MQNLVKTTCYEPEYLHSFILENSRMPTYLRKHIEHCELCQENLILYHEKTPIPDIVFGKKFQLLLKNADVIMNLSDGEISKGTFYGQIRKILITYRNYIEVVAYGSILFGLIHLFLYLTS